MNVNFEVINRHLMAILHLNTSCKLKERLEMGIQVGESHIVDI